MAYPKITLSAFAFAGALVLGAGVSSLTGTSESSEQALHPSVKLTGPATVQAADGAIINDAALISGRVARVPTQQGEIQIISQVPEGSADTDESSGSTNHSSSAKLSGPGTSADLVKSADASSLSELVGMEGTWVEVDSEQAENYMDAVISNGKITVTYHLNHEEVATIFWTGTYEAGEGNYSWVSHGETETMRKSPMASTETEKEFTVRDGVLSFPIASEDGIRTVNLQKHEDHR